jgi:hypothetical protein
MEDFGETRETRSASSLCLKHTHFYTRLRKHTLSCRWRFDSVALASYDCNAPEDDHQLKNRLR